MEEVRKVIIEEVTRRTWKKRQPEERTFIELADGFPAVSIKFRQMEEETERCLNLCTITADELRRISEWPARLEAEKLVDTARSEAKEIADAAIQNCEKKKQAEDRLEKREREAAEAIQKEKQGSGLRRLAEVQKMLKTETRPHKRQRQKSGRPEA